MAIDPDILVLRARALLTSEEPAAKLPVEDFYAAIPSMVSAWNEKNRLVRAKTGIYRKIYATTGNISVTNGKADVEAVIKPLGIMPEAVRKAEIYIAYGGNPELAVSFVNSRDRLRLPGVQDRHFVKAYFDGKFMYFGNVGDAVLTNIVFTFTAECEPAQLPQFPDDLEGDLALILADLIRSYNTDLEHKGISRRQAQK